MLFSVIKLSYSYKNTENSSKYSNFIAFANIICKKIICILFSIFYYDAYILWINGGDLPPQLEHGMALAITQGG